ncbi:MAG TPA: hypothetical protein VM580_10405 [Labilithrix sp.]|nr:hypothetical protein [Labilithrix sp.]
MGRDDLDFGQCYEEEVKRTLAALVTFVSVPLSLATACDDATESACQVDTDCPSGTICRERQCGPVGAEAGTSTPVDATASTCTSDGLSCNTADECCARACTDGRCGSPAPPPSCRDLYEICQDDCCQGLTCTAGVCR